MSSTDGKKCADEIVRGDDTVRANFKRFRPHGCVAIADAIRQSTLRSLDLRSNDIVAEGIRVIAKAFRHHESLRYLDLSCNRIRNEGATFLGEALSQNDALVVLDIASSGIEANGVVSIAEGLKHNKALRRLNLRFNSIGRRGAMALAEAFARNKTLVDLEIACESIGKAGGIKAICKGLKHNNTLCKLLLVHSCIDEVGARAIGEALLYNGSQPPSFSRCKGGYNDRILDDKNDDSNSFLPVHGRASSWKRNRHDDDGLRLLDLNHNRLGGGGAYFLANGLKHNRTLLVLDLEFNHIGNTGAMAIADALEHFNDTLQTLNLGINQIGDEGGCALGNALKHNRSLEKLQLSQNHIGDSGACVIADALMDKNDTLLELNLGFNRIGNVGGVAIAGTLRHSRTLRLQKLLMGGNSMTPQGTLEMVHALRHNGSLCEMSLCTSDSLEDRLWSKRVLLETLQHNTSLQSVGGVPTRGDCHLYLGVEKIIKRNKAIVEKRSVMIRDDDMALSLWPHVIAKWPANVMFGIFQERLDPLLRSVGY